jgi:Zn-dependent M28 family amino/carboxypeptidase
MKNIGTLSAALSVLLFFSCNNDPTNSDPSGHPATAGDLVNRVSQDRLEDLVSGLSGAVPVTIDGSSYTISTRATGSGTPIMKATQYAYELFASFGLSVEYQNWSAGGYNCRNVVATKTGTTRQDEIVIICANIDCLSSSETAPGADRNASGSAGVLECARIMSGQQFERTVRFVLFTGTEQGFLGSSAYASAVGHLGENVVAVYYLMMIGYDDLGGPVMRLKTRTATNPGYAGDLALAQAFSDTVDDYSTALTPVIDADGFSQGDHVSFWTQGIPAVCVIEDQEDFNPFFRTANDTADRLNMTYLTNIVRTVLGTVIETAVLL